MRQLQLKVKLSVLPHDMIMEIISYLPSYFLFHISMRNIWEGVFGSSMSVLGTREDQMEQHDDENRVISKASIRNCNTLFDEILMERLCKKLYNHEHKFGLSTPLSIIQIIYIIMETICKKFVMNNPHVSDDCNNIETICKVLRMSLELSKTVFIQKLHLESYSFMNTTDEQRKKQFHLVEETFKNSQWSYQELHFLHEFSCRFGYVFLLSEDATQSRRTWKSPLIATSETSHAPTMEISFNIIKDEPFNTNVLSIFNLFELINDSQQQLMNKLLKYANKCVKIRGHIYLSKTNLRLPRSDPHIRSVILEIFPQFTNTIECTKDKREIMEVAEELMLHFISFARNINNYNRPIEREIMLQIFWFPALHQKSTLKCITTRKDIFYRLRVYLLHLSPASIDSIAAMEVTCIPSCRKIKLTLIPTIIPIFLKNICLIALICACSKLNDFLMHKYLKENMNYEHFFSCWLFWSTFLAIMAMIVIGYKAFIDACYSLYTTKEFEIRMTNR